MTALYTHRILYEITILTLSQIHQNYFNSLWIVDFKAVSVPSQNKILIIQPFNNNELLCG